MTPSDQPQYFMNIFLRKLHEAVTMSFSLVSGTVGDLFMLDLVLFVVLIATGCLTILLLLRSDDELYVQINSFTIFYVSWGMVNHGEAHPNTQLWMSEPQF